MEYTIRYDERVMGDLSRLDKSIQRRIRDVIETKLQTRPDIFGKPLRHSLMGFRALRVGHCRIVYLIEGTSVLVLLIGDRKFIYQEAAKRLK